MALFCVACGHEQPEDDPPLTKGAMCVQCKTCNTFTTMAPPSHLKPWDGEITASDLKYLRSMKISPK